jgi:hypothetical protein
MCSTGAMLTIDAHVSNVGVITRICLEASLDSLQRPLPGETRQESPVADEE